MRRILFPLAISALAFNLCQANSPKIPTGLGYCVTVEDSNGTLIGVITVSLHKPDPANLDEFRASLRNAITLVGRTSNRPDVIQAAGDVRLIDNPIPPLHKPRTPRLNPQQSADTGCHSVCSCASPIYCSEASTYSAVRLNPHARGGGGGGGICGCGGACSTCAKCTVVCDGR